MLRALSVSRSLGGARLEEQVLTLVREQVGTIILGPIFVSVGLVVSASLRFVGHRGTNFLVVDVSGHGVGAALIASMIKVAMQSFILCAHDPHEVLRGLNRILSGQIRGQLISAGLFMARHGKW
jgi:serine phosphatase RsbU (regulator of sigma subunit)